ncbi:MAG: metallophosphoesterase [Candidatus Micrarchaeia archaeon]
MEIIEGLPVIYIKSISSIVCSDLHLGYEGVLADRGTFLPKTNLMNILKILKKAISNHKPKKLIITGDIKNDFSKVHLEELNEYSSFINAVINELKINDIRIIKGNHDNFLDSLKKDNVIIYSKQAKIGKYLFIHGSELPTDKRANFIIMGHIHPSILLFTDSGKKEKLQCFLICRNLQHQSLIVLPAMSYFAEGMSINIESVERMAPIFQKIFNVNDSQVICIGEGETLNFGKLEYLKRYIG